MTCERQLLGQLGDTRKLNNKGPSFSHDRGQVHRPHGLAALNSRVGFDCRWITEHVCNAVLRKLPENARCRCGTGTEGEVLRPASE